MHYQSAVYIHLYIYIHIHRLYIYIYIYIVIFIYMERKTLKDKASCCMTFCKPRELSLCYFDTIAL